MSSTSVNVTQIDLSAYEIVRKIVKKSGEGGHVMVPKELIDKEIIVLLPIKKKFAVVENLGK